MKAGKFYGVGVGPGDPKLVTFKAAEVLKSADVVCSPRSGKNKRSIALPIVKHLLRKDCEILAPLFPMTRNKKLLEKRWNAAARLIESKLKRGKDVAFITIGDPLFYSTYSYILRRMQKDEALVETIPGVSSLSSCMAELNLPLVEGEENFAVLPAEYGLEGLEKIAKKFDTVVLMKVSRSFGGIVKKLEKLNLLENSIFVSKCGTKNFFSSELKYMRGKKADFLSMIIVLPQGKRNARGLANAYRKVARKQDGLANARRKK